MSFKLLPIALVLVSAPVFAEQEKQTVASLLGEPVEEAKYWSGDIDFGYINFSGNTEETTTSGSFTLLRIDAPWKFAVHAEGLGSEKEDERTAEKYSGFTRVSYNFTEKNYLFARASYEEDKFSGFENQYTATAGVGWNIYDLDTFNWDLETGLGYRFATAEDLVDELTGDITEGEDEEEPVVRLATAVKWDFSETGSFVQLLGTEIGEDNTISYSETAVKLQLVGKLALKISYKIKYTEEVPVDIEKADKETVVSVSYSF
ncbi:YdiY family protein [Colwelliaceae bacterium BS250]